MSIGIYPQPAFREIGYDAVMRHGIVANRKPPESVTRCESQRSAWDMAGGSMGGECYPTSGVWGSTGKATNEMIRSLCACLLVAWALLIDGAALGAEQFASAEEARAMLDRAVIALKANEAAALKAFNDEKNKSFRDRDLYIFCFSLADGKFIAYQNPLMLGIDVRELMLDKDPIGQRAYDAVAKAAEGDVVSIDYSFPKPGSKQPATKESLQTRIGNQACGVSYFR
jgi:hypothetical protein